MKELLESEKAETLIHYMLKEVEHTWRIKFGDCKEFVNKEGVDQLVLIIDLKGAKLKDITNKQVDLFGYSNSLPIVQCYFQVLIDRVPKILPRIVR